MGQIGLNATVSVMVRVSGVVVRVRDFMVRVSVELDLRSEFALVSRLGRGLGLVFMIKGKIRVRLKHLCH
jgi:hypothetical protein